MHSLRNRTIFDLDNFWAGSPYYTCIYTIIKDFWEIWPLWIKQSFCVFNFNITKLLTSSHYKEKENHALFLMVYLLACASIHVCISMLYGCLYLLAFGAKTARWPVFYFYFITDNLLILFCFSWYVRERQETLRKRYHHRSKIIRSFEIQNSKISGKWQCKRHFGNLIEWRAMNMYYMLCNNHAQYAFV